MSIDILDYMIAALSFSLESHKASLQSGVNPVYDLLTPGWAWLIKGASGFPWDGNSFDADFVYQVYTEGPNGWTDATSYKQFVSKSTSTGGILWCPRMIPEDGLPVVLATPDSSYDTWEKGAVVGAVQNVGPVRTITSGPSTITVGALGSVSVVTVQYIWETTMEVNYYALGFGLVRWQQYSLVTGSPVLVTDNLFDQVTAGGCPAVIGPAGVTF